MALRNDDSGYGLVTKALHWATVAALAAQLAVGYLLDVDDSGRGRGRGRGEGDSGRGRGRGDDDDQGLLSQAWNGDEPMLTVHVGLGLLLVALVVTRLVWRRATPLPPWADCLSEGDRRWAHRTERVLYAVMLAVPATGLVLVLTDGDVLPLHVASHVVLFAALGSHLGLVLKHSLVRRNRLVSRML